MKIALGLFSLVSFFVGGFIGFVRGQPDAIHHTLLAVIWAPSVECARPKGTTMSLTMTKEEREALLADVHVAGISVAEDGHGPLAVPIWYSYEPGGEAES